MPETFGGHCLGNSESWLKGKKNCWFVFPKVYMQLLGYCMWNVMNTFSEILLRSLAWSAQKQRHLFSELLENVYFTILFISRKQIQGED